jgi:hypothetical protein
MPEERRQQLYDFVEKEFIGPDPVDWEGLVQENGQEILAIDPPSSRYIAGVLYPQETTEAYVEVKEEPEIDEEPREDQDENLIDNGFIADKSEYLKAAEELINRSNAYRQSAMSLTVAIKPNDTITAIVNAGQYKEIDFFNEKKQKKTKRYLRKPIRWINSGSPLAMPESGIKSYTIDDTSLQFDITYRYEYKNCHIYTVTLENSKKNNNSSSKEEDSYFQSEFRIISKNGFQPLPENQRINADEDDQSNNLLYRNTHNYAIGHGCAADWEDDKERVSWISTSVFPSYEVKPIVPCKIDGVSLEMLAMSPYGNSDDSIRELELMCDKYGEWINQLSKKKEKLDECYKAAAQKNIESCVKCLSRMKNGVKQLRENKTIRTAFQYMNLAMLMQQLHYNLPLQTWKDDGRDGICLENPVTVMPDVLNKETWYDAAHKTYGKWRPFQIAFILLNLEGMYNCKSPERKLVDLIWFPTGGGKTEAYLGLSAYTIFLRRLMKKDDNGTAIFMRYTLRLLTAQQYERAASMICACDIIRKDHEDIFGKNRISIGLWVGISTTPNRMQKAVEDFDKLKSGKTNENPFVLLKCPWCGAQMGIVQRKKGIRELPGYYKVRGKHGKNSIIFKCQNEDHCAFSSIEYHLPLYIVDESIYDKTPTLLIGTVDKFAILPFFPKAQCLFGYNNGVKTNSPDLIIQDELHLISGPLGSMVGHYETLINELCATKTSSGNIYPKIIASTATISRAKEQCNELYDCGKENVFQFPPSGLDAGDSFFAVEDKTQKGRKYVGIMATASPSDDTTAIRLFSSLLYGAKALDVTNENERDPYWTNMGYFNSIRELGQAATWIRADIDQYLDVIYKRRFEEKRYASREEYQKNRRYIHRDEELTSRISGDKVTASLSNLSITYPPQKFADGYGVNHPIDICHATNMISVGLDVSRLGLMTVAGQPKTTSEYIQATSRVGRDTKNAPGIIFVLLRPGRPRDRSHYEHFKYYHSRLYSHVERKR